MFPPTNWILLTVLIPWLHACWCVLPYRFVVLWLHAPSFTPGFLARPRSPTSTSVGYRKRVSKTLANQANVTSQNWIFLPIPDLPRLSPNLDWATSSTQHQRSPLSALSFHWNSRNPSDSHLHPVTNTSNVFSGGYERQVVTVCDVNHVIYMLSLISFIKAGVIVYNSGPTTYIRLGGHHHNHPYSSFFRCRLGIAWHPPRQAPSTLVHLASGVPIVLILTGGWEGFKKN